MVLAIDWRVWWQRVHLLMRAHAHASPWRGRRPDSMKMFNDLWHVGGIFFCFPDESPTCPPGKGHEKEDWSPLRVEECPYEWMRIN